MFYIAICDDDIHYIEYLKRLLLQSGVSSNNTSFLEYHSSKCFVESLEQLTDIDLLFLDIQMPGIDGNQVAKYFRKSFPHSILVFCSGVYLPTVESFFSEPYRYLLKEYSDTEMLKELKSIIHKMELQKNEPYIIGSWHTNTIRLRPSEIFYVSIGRNHSVIHMNPDIQKYEFEDNLICKDKLADLYLLLKDYGFEYAHNSYIVNLHAIKRKTITELELLDGTVLSISRSKEKTFRLAFVKNMAAKYD